MTVKARDFFTRFVAAINERDVAALEQMIHPDFVSSIPQSGERSRGFEGFWAQLEAYPGGAPQTPAFPDARILGDDERWAITPAYTVVPLAAGNEFTIVMRSQYPDGSYWRVISLVEMRDDRLYRMENYFAPEFDPPEWRLPFVEVVSSS